MKDRALPTTVAFESSLERDILKVLLYFDVFNHPLTADEIYTYLPSNSTSSDEIRSLCLKSPLNTLVTFRDKVFHLKDAPTGCVEERFLKEQRARTRWRIAKIMARVIRQFPFVRGVFVSGELSKGVASPAGDVDFFIVTSDRRLWISRTLLILFKKIVLLNSKKYFCLNHFITESNLTVEEHNLYSALEIATLKPIFDASFYHRYLKANSWISDFYPNLNISNGGIEHRKDRRPLVQSMFESFFFNPIADRLDDWLRRKWDTIWKSRYPGLSEQKRQQIFRCEPGISTAYAGDFLTKILDAYNSRLNSYGLASN